MGALGLGVFSLITGFIGVGVAAHVTHHLYTKGRAFEEAKELAQGKGIVNIGAGPHRSLLAQRIARDPEVLVNVDMAVDGMANLIQLDIDSELLPFADKQFGCAFASHILEHLDDWQFALAEMVRVADYVVIVLPHPCSVGNWINPEHKQHFSPADIDKMLTLYPNVVVYY